MSLNISKPSRQARTCWLCGNIRARWLDDPAQNLSNICRKKKREEWRKERKKIVWQEKLQKRIYDITLPNSCIDRSLRVQWPTGATRCNSLPSKWTNEVLVMLATALRSFVNWPVISGTPSFSYPPPNRRAVNCVSVARETISRTSGAALLGNGTNCPPWLIARVLTRHGLGDEGLLLWRTRRRGWAVPVYFHVNRFTHSLCKLSFGYFVAGNRRINRKATALVDIFFSIARSLVLMQLSKISLRIATKKRHQSFNIFLGTRCQFIFSTSQRKFQARRERLTLSHIPTVKTSLLLVFDHEFPSLSRGIIG